MAIDIRPLKDTSNAAIMDAIRRDASITYRERIPAAVDAGVTNTLDNLMKYRVHWNEFLDAFVNRIATVIIRNELWSNPLAMFKRGLISGYGDSIEEIQMGLIEARVYDPDREYMEKDLFGTHRPDMQSNFHTVNRQVYYPITVNEALLKRAFLEPDGLASFVSDMMNVPRTSDEWDEFLMTVSLFPKYEANGGFYHMHVPDVSNVEAVAAEDARYTLRKLRAMAETLPFISTKYNAAHMPVSAKPDDLILIASPEFNAAIDVEALAGAFNIDRANFAARTVTVPQEHFGIEGAQAILTTKDFFVIADTMLENTSQQNAVAVQNNYFLHHWGIISASRFAPALLLTTGSDDESITVYAKAVSVDTITFEPLPDGTTPTGATRGGLVALVSAAKSGTGDALPVVWSLTGAKSTRTFITQTGVLHVGEDETATSVTVAATATTVDADDPRAVRIEKTLSVPITGDTLTLWPVVTKGNALVDGISINGNPLPFVDATLTYTYARSEGEMVDKNSFVVSTGPGVDTTITKSGNVYTIVVDGGSGNKATYTVTVS